MSNIIQVFKIPNQNHKTQSLCTWINQIRNVCLNEGPVGNMNCLLSLKKECPSVFKIIVSYWVSKVT
jgi:hypothetical protein